MSSDAHHRDALRQARQRVSMHVLGHHGVHGVGLSFRDETVRVYADQAAAVPRAELDALAAPFQVEVLEDPRAALG